VFSLATPMFCSSARRAARESKRMTLEESRARLVQLGVPLPVIEGDYEEVDDETDRSRGS
jgi:hypothetical protein